MLPGAGGAYSGEGHPPRAMENGSGPLLEASGLHWAPYNFSNLAIKLDVTLSFSVSLAFMQYLLFIRATSKNTVLQRHDIVERNVSTYC